MRAGAAVVGAWDLAGWYMDLGEDRVHPFGPDMVRRFTLEGDDLVLSGEAGGLTRHLCWHRAG